MKEPTRGFFGSPSRELAALAEAVRPVDVTQPAGTLQRRFRLEAAWGARAASPREIAESLVLWARRLRNIDARLDLVFEDRRYVCGSAAEPVLDGAREHTLDRMLGRVWAATRDGVVKPPKPAAPALGTGLTLCAWLDHTTSAARLRVRVGHHAAPDADNGVCIDVDDSHFLLPDRPLVVDLLCTLIDGWQPDIAGLHSSRGGAGESSPQWWLGWKRDGFDPHRAPLRRGWPGTLPGGGEALLGGRLWEWPVHSPAALAGRRPFD
jgi:hypothetical protein